MRKFVPNANATINGEPVPKGFFTVDGPEATKTLALALDALKVAKQTIFIMHGDLAWKEYQNSPEMKCINTTIEVLSGTEPMRTN